MFLKPTVSKAPTLLSFVHAHSSPEGGAPLAAITDPKALAAATSAAGPRTPSFHSILWARSRTVEDEATQDVPL
jgi:hypothetical protein